MFPLVSVFGTAYALELPQVGCPALPLPSLVPRHLEYNTPNPISFPRHKTETNSSGTQATEMSECWTQTPALPLPRAKLGDWGVSFACSPLSWEKGLWPMSPMNFPSGSTEATFTLRWGVGASELVYGYFTKGVGLWVVVQLVSLAWEGKSEA
uniref:Uncharacterized protein n=1 Tax=Molossus molossus TaxID=27622 RepID=A0A7J8FZ79_MOLMO|nr:hypothetical protein HJG59_008208 [Molossus molossus]